MEPQLQILREPDRFRLTGLSRVQWWRMERAGTAPRRIQLGPNSVGWLAKEIETWIAERAARRNAAQG